MEDETRAGVRIHYPSLLQLDDSRVLVMYSRFYLGKCGAPSQVRPSRYCSPRHGGLGESLVPPYTHASVSLSWGAG